MNVVPARHLGDGRQGTQPLSRSSAGDGPPG
jgi:hypothetical protein